MNAVPFRLISASIPMKKSKRSVAVECSVANAIQASIAVQPTTQYYERCPMIVSGVVCVAYTCESMRTF